MNQYNHSQSATDLPPVHLQTSLPSGHSTARGGGQTVAVIRKSQTTRGSPQRHLSIDQVTPELAAQIIKHYVLPMFDPASKVSFKGKLYQDLKLTTNLFERLEAVRQQHFLALEDL